MSESTPTESTPTESAPSDSTPAGANANATIPDAMIPDALAREIRRIAHDLSNALEIIVQTSYLLSLAELKEPATEWLKMLDGGVNKALELNLQLREYVKAHVPR